MAEQISAEESSQLDLLVQRYVRNRSLIRRFLMSIVGPIIDATAEGEPLADLVHSVKYRMKDPEHLRDKLMRKLAKCRANGQPFDITTDNLLLRITDLGGLRILHLHTKQMAQLHRVLLDLLDQAQCDLFEQPFANIWDEESKVFFEQIGIRTEVNPRLYSSVHYVVRPRSTTTNVTCEVQVRTLADEIWGEIDHKLNYPQQHPSVACREQIKVLSRVSSSCSRLVDAIVASHVAWSVEHSPNVPGDSPVDLGCSAAPEPGPAVVGKVSGASSTAEVER